MLIKDFNRSLFNKTKNKGKKHLCMHCFSFEKILYKQKSNCMAINGEQAIRMPQTFKNTLQFQNHQRQMSVPFVIYADFEPITEEYKGVSLVMQNHILINTRNIVAVVTAIKWFVVTMTKYTKPEDAAGGRILPEDCCSRI